MGQGTNRLFVQSRHCGQKHDQRKTGIAKGTRNEVHDKDKEWSVGATACRFYLKLLRIAVLPEDSEAQCARSLQEVCPYANYQNWGSVTENKDPAIMRDSWATRCFHFV